MISDAYRPIVPFIMYICIHVLYEYCICVDGVFEPRRSPSFPLCVYVCVCICLFVLYVSVFYSSSLSSRPPGSKPRSRLLLLFPSAPRDRHEERVAAMFGLALQMASMAGAAVFGAFVMRRTQTDSNDDEDYYTIHGSPQREHAPQVCRLG